MKKQLLCALLLAGLSLQLFALRPGNKALPLANVKMLRGENLRLPGASDTAPKLRAVVFILCRAVNSNATTAMLNDLQRKFRDDLRVEIVTPDAAMDAEALLKAVGKIEIAFGIDTERKTTKEYMAGSLLYPMAFLIDRKGTVVWCGEAVDMAEKLQPALDGKLSVSTEAKIAELTAELQQLLRDSSETRMKRICKQIFDLEPGNAAALRIRLFTLENTGRIDEAKSLIDDQLKAAPRLVRIYFTAVDFAARYDSSDAELGRIVSAFERNIADPAIRIRMAWMLLERFPYHTSALQAACRILRRPLPESGLARANAAAGRALLEYRLGNPEAAAKYQHEAVRILNRSGSTEELGAAQNREAYFRTVLKLKNQ